jgi:hypothetical protein
VGHTLMPWYPCMTVRDVQEELKPFLLVYRISHLIEGADKRPADIKPTRKSEARRQCTGATSMV